MSACVVALGACGAKVLMKAINEGVVNVEDSIMVNSTSKDFPSEYSGQKIIISPNNMGCGKERSISKAYTLNIIKKNVFEQIDFSKYSSVYILSSSEGGTGSGSAPLLAQWFEQVLKKNVHLVIFTGFNEDVRGISNTIEFFKEIKDNIICHTISNAAFLNESNGNKARAEELANEEFVKKFRILSGQTLIPGDQNIDDTDIIKLANTHGYTSVEYKELDKSLGDSSDYDKIIKRMIYESKSIKSENHCASKLGVIFNLNETSQEALTDIFGVLKDNYGMSYECFKHIQYDGKKEYIAFIASGMKLPIDEMTKLYDTYLEQSKMINKDSDSFFEKMRSLELLEDNKKFDMIQPLKKGISTEEFLSNF